MAQSVTIKSSGCGFDVHSNTGNEIFIYIYVFISKNWCLVSRQSSALRSATQHAMPLELSGKWGTDCLNTRFRAEADLFDS